MQKDKQKAWNDLFTPEAIAYLTKALGRTPTVEDGIKYVNTLEELRAGKQVQPVLGKGAKQRQYNELIQNLRKTRVRPPRPPRPSIPRPPRPY